MAKEFLGPVKYNSEFLDYVIDLSRCNIFLK